MDWFTSKANEGHIMAKQTSATPPPGGLENPTVPPMLNRFWFRLLLVIAVPPASQATAYLVLSSLGAAGEVYSNAIINAVLLIACLVLIWGMRLTAEDIGLKIIRGRFWWHVIIGLSLFIAYILYCIFAIGISRLRPITSQTVFGLLNYLIVAFAEEIHIRGICYGIVQKRYSDRTALIASTLLFGLLHFRQGAGMLSKFTTGLLWGAVRYTTGMIFLLIIPLHLTYNAIWLLFEGAWENPPMWAYSYPLFELLAALAIVGFRKRVRIQNKQLAGA